MRFGNPLKIHPNRFRGQARRPGRPALFALALGWLVLFTPPAGADEGKVHGTARYEKIPYRDGDNFGLQLGKPAITPIIGAKVELVAGEKVLGHTFTVANGAYEIPWKLARGTRAFVRVMAISNHALIHDNQGKTYFHALEAFPLSGGDTAQNLLVKDDQGAGAFNIIEVIRRADAFLETIQPGCTANIRDLQVSWTPGYNGPRGWTTHFSPRDHSAFIYGDRKVDSDEFDDCVLAHEYGHFVMKVFCGRDDSPGNIHSRGLKLDPRLAWSEGWANFFSCAVLDSPEYIDTGRDEQGRETYLAYFNFDQKLPDLPKLDYWNEEVAGWTLWHIHRQAPPESKTPYLGTGFREIWNILVSPSFKERRHVTLIDFCDLLVQKNPQLARGIATVLAANGIQYDPAKQPSVANPYHRFLQFGKDYKGIVNSLDPTTHLPLAYNSFEATAVYNFKLHKKSKVKLEVEILDAPEPSSSQLVLFLEDQNPDRPVALSIFSVGISRSGSIVKELSPGTYYVRVASNYLTKNSAAYRLKATVDGGPKQASRWQEIPWERDLAPRTMFLPNRTGRFAFPYDGGLFRPAC